MNEPLPKALFNLGGLVAGMGHTASMFSMKISLMLLSSLPEKESNRVSLSSISVALILL